MQVVIDIPEDLYEECKRIGDGCDTLFEAIRKGKVLPKGHGRLIDADELKKIIQANDVLSMIGFNVRLCDINNTPTIIEADKEESEGIK